MDERVNEGVGEWMNRGDDESTKLKRIFNQSLGLCHGT